MKKLLTLSVALFLAMSSYAQDLGLGLKAGLNLASINTDEDFDYGTNTGFHVGAFANLKVSDKFGIQPELIYSKQGAQADLELFGVKIESTVNTSYLNIPVMANFYLIDGLSINVGPQVGLLLSAEAESDGEEQDIKDEYKSLAIAAGAGLTYELPMGLSIAARYNLGLTDITEDYEDPDFGTIEDKSTNQVIQVSVGYKLF